MNKHISDSPSVFHTYTDSLAPSGRKGLISLLNKCAAILDGQTAENYPWQSLNFTLVTQLKTVLLADGYSVASVNLALSGLKGLAQTAFNMYQMNAEDLGRIKAIKRVRGDGVRKRRSLNQIEVKKLLIVCKQQTQEAKRLRDTALLMVAITGGLRVSELVGLKIANFDFKRRVLYVEQGKGRKNREVYLPRSTCQSIRRWLNMLEDGKLVFRKVAKTGRVLDSLTAAGVTSIFKTMAKEADIDTFSPHDLRRTYITDLLDNGVDINTVRQMAGHQDISTTARYDFRDDHCKKAAVNRLSMCL